ncbi:hypothetical protein LIER_08001 [Lithospermum erythrorhizon]|uniref:Uncharacterized protein n=1 Tax=Lithospermum erythrorhizon TaxID=34254 RepID=A0AAV3PAM1_LITER
MPQHEPRGGNTNEEAQESDEEGIVAVITKRRKATSMLKLNENRTRVGNKRKEDILTATDEEGPFPDVITISPKLMQGTHVADILLVTVDTGGASGSGTDDTARILRDEILHLDGVIQSSLARKSFPEARLRSPSGEADPTIDPAVDGSGADASHT